MINPGAPLNDADDEWVELYNPNETPVSLAGMKVQTGTSFSHSYTFTDEILSPFGYLTIYSASTPIALSNTSGAVRVLATDGAVWGNTVSYEDVEEGNSFARSDNGEWSWTTSPTPSELNIFTVAPELIPPLVVSESTTSKSITPKTAKTTAPKTSSTAKVTAVKASTTAAKKAATTPKTTKASAPKSASLATKPPANPSTSHPVALAGFAILALGYALYEYRDDFSNKLRRARRYFETRRGGGTGL